MGDKANGASSELERIDAEIACEIRLSLVLYGGVSLAVYMNGVCQELLNLVKATSPRAMLDASDLQTKLRQQYQLAARITSAEIEAGYRSFVRASTQRADSAIESLDVANASVGEIVDLLGDRPLRRRVVIDVLSGSSAGGLNALFMSRALLHNGDLSSIAELMVEKADFQTLLNDQPTGESVPWPKSLLDGDEFYRLLVGALDDQRGEGTPLTEALDCYMTMTDLKGVPAPRARLADATFIDELQHRAVAHLRYGTRSSYGAERNDFFGAAGESSPIEPFLAFVGRATAAHPAAFHPAQLRQLSDLLERQPPFAPDDPRWTSLVEPSYHGRSLEQRWFSDGGDLDNKPFTHAIEPVDDRRATIPIERRIVYVEPDPGSFGDSWSSPAAPPLAGYTLGAFTLPRQEGIVDDLKRIDERNVVAARLKSSLRDVRTSVIVGAAGRFENATSVRWERQRATRATRLLYELERHRGVVDDLCDWVAELARRAGHATVSRDEARASVDKALTSALTLAANADAQAQAQAQADTAQQPTVTEQFRATDKRGDAGPVVDDKDSLSRRRILLWHDVRYRLRRLNLLDQLLSEMQSETTIDGPSRIAQLREEVSSRSDASQSDRSTTPLVKRLVEAFATLKDSLSTAPGEALDEQSPSEVSASLEDLLNAGLVGSKPEDRVLIEDLLREIDSSPASDRLPFGYRSYRKRFNETYVHLTSAIRTLWLDDAYESNSVLDSWSNRRDSETKRADSADMSQRQTAVIELTRAIDKFRTCADRASGLDALADEAIQARDKLLRTLLPATAHHAREVVRAACDERIFSAWVDFDDYDIHLLPRYGLIEGELSRIETTRFSPIDATSMHCDPTAVKLGGAAVAHFGAFFDKRWRRNDILWGRLDASEMIIRMLLPRRDNEPAIMAAVRDQLIRQAQLAIIDESRDAIDDIADLENHPVGLRKDMDASNVHAYLSDKLDLSLSIVGDEKRAAKRTDLVRRVPRVIGKMLALRDIDPWDNPPKASTARSIERAGQVGTSVVELAVPKGRLAKLARYALLPILFLGGVAGLVVAYGDEQRLWMLLPLGALMVALGLEAGARRLRSGDQPRAGDALTALGGGLVFASLVMPGTRHLSDPARAWFYTMQFVTAVAGLIAIALLDLIGTRTWLRRAIAVVLTLAAAAALIGAWIVDAHALLFVLGAIALAATGAGLSIALSSLQGLIGNLAEPKREPTRERGSGNHADGTPR